MTISAIPPPQSPQPTTLSPPSSLPSSPRDEPSAYTSHFVQALHDYLPTNAPADAAVSCLFFRKGAIIEVLTRDDSGWWDGQCGGVRGWFPSNYVGRIGEAVRHSADFEDEHSQRELEDWRNSISSAHVRDHEASPEVTPLATSNVDQDNSKLLLNRAELARALLNEEKHVSSDEGSSLSSSAHLQQHLQQQQLDTLVKQVDDKVHELLEACEHPETANIQLAIFHVVSSIRAVLTAANTVSNDSSLLKCYPELARQRKKLLSALSKLVLKGKELQAAQDGALEAVLQQIPTLTNTLAIEFNTFVDLLHIAPQVVGDGHQASPRSSLLSVDSVATNSTQSLRQQLVEARLSSASLIAKAVPLADAQHILHNLLEHQATIDDLMHKLQSTIEKFLSQRQRATEMLEMARRSVEAVRTFLAVVEHVCSNVGELDYKHCSVIPEDPHLVALVLAKEAVYSAITNLVTSVRALASPRGRHEEHDMKQIQDNCEKVIQTINDSAARVRTCLQVDEQDIIEKEHVYAMKKELESSVDTRRNQTLSILGRKATSLNVLQHQYDEPDDLRRDLKQPTTRDNHLEDIAENDTIDNSNDKGVSEQQVQDLDVVAKNPLVLTIDTNQQQQQQQQQTENKPSSAAAADIPPLPPTVSTSLTRRSRALSKPGRRPNMVAPAARVTSGASMNSVRTSQSSQLRQSIRSSVESSNMTPLTTPEIMSPVTEASIDHQQQQQQHQRPVSSKLLPQPELRLSTSKSTPITEAAGSNNQRIRRPRESSMSAMRMSVKPRATDDLRSSATSENLMDPQQIRRVSSLLSISGGSDRRDSLASNERHSKNMEPEPWFLKQRSFSEDELMLNAEGQVTGATIEALVEKLTLHEKSPDLIFTRAFFYNFRLFTTPSVFLDLLIQRFGLKPPAEVPLNPQDLALWTNRVLLPVRLRVYNVIKSWLETYFSFDHDACIEKTLIDFTAGPMSEAMPGPAKRMMELIRKRFASRTLACTGRKMSYTKDLKSLYQQQKPSSSGSHLSLSSGSSLFSTLALFEDHSSSLDSTAPPPTPNVARSLRSTLKKASSLGNLTMVHISEFDPTELARQLTLMESSMFCQIEPSEMIGQEFKKKVGQSSAVHVKAMIQRSTQITSWVSDTILRETDAKKRAQMIKFWIKVGDSCLQLSNYNTLMAIRSALDSTSIARLKKTWDLVSAKNKALYDPIYRATDSRRNFAEYRNRLKNAVAPCLPFLGVYLTDMTFIDDGNANHRTSPNGHQLINFDKYIKITRILNEIDQFQIPYRLTEVEEIQRYLLQCLETVETDNGVFYAKSLQLEPREEEFDIKSFISNLS